VFDNPDRDDLTRLHESMIKEQIIERGINSPRTVEAMREVPRHPFLPQSQWGHAYDDKPQPIGHGQTISQPYIVSLMTSQFESLPEGSRILEIGSGCGYQTAILVHMGFEVHSIEIVQELMTRSEATLAKLGLSPYSQKRGDGRLGIPGAAPFSGVIAAACASELPTAWTEQLGVPGILVAPVQGRKGQILVRLQKHSEDVFPSQEKIASVRFVKLI